MASLHESGENYLETILILEQKLGFVRSIDIVHELDYSKPSISRAVGILKKSGLVTVDASGVINLTETGRKKANQIYERHRIITEYLCITLDVSEDIAEADACRIEHVISQEVFDKIKEVVSKSREKNSGKL